MNIRNLFIILFILAIIPACVQTSKDVKTSSRPIIQTFKFINGTVTSTDGKSANIKIILPELETSNLPFTNRITQKIINKSFLLENTETTVNNKKAKIYKIYGDTLSIIFEQPPELSAGDSVKIYIPKKIIAISDFEVIRGKDKSIGVLSMESLVTSMVNSGQFNIVERQKLKAVLKELEIGLTGLTDSGKVKKVGELLQADMILTGTFANLGSYWNVNLRLVNVSTGLIVAAFEEKALFSDIKPNAVRDISNINENFEGEVKRGWLIFSTKRWGATQSIKITKETGAVGTSSSIMTKFRLDNRPSFTRIVNLRNRDLSLFSGIEFYAKSDVELNTHFSMRDENRNNWKIKDHWFTTIQTSSEWKKYRINFYEMSLSQIFEKKHPGGDGVLSLDLITGFGFGVSTMHNPVSTSGTLWIDEVKFY